MPNPTFPVRRSFHLWKAFLILAAIAVTACWLILTPAGVLNKLNAIGYAVCHQISERSFAMGSGHMPLCIRCTGVFTAALITLAFLFLRGRRNSLPRPLILALMGCLILFFILDGTNSYLGFFPGVPTLYAPTTFLRLASGSGFGMVLGSLLAFIFHNTVWKTAPPLPLLSGWKDFGLLVLLIAGVDAVLLSGIGWVRIPLGVLSALTVPVILTLVYTLLALFVFNKDNQIDAWTELMFPVLGGWAVTLLQIGLITWIRFSLTGTWAGFPATIY